MGDTDFDCDVDVDGTDATLFKSDFGRSPFLDPWPACRSGDERRVSKKILGSPRSILDKIYYVYRYGQF